MILQFGTEPSGAMFSQMQSLGNVALSISLLVIVPPYGYSRASMGGGVKIKFGVVVHLAKSVFALTGVGITALYPLPEANPALGF